MAASRVVLITGATRGIGDETARLLQRDGHERTWQVNYLAPVLLTALLDEPLNRAAHGRVVTVSSSLHRAEWIDWNDLEHQRRCRHPGVIATDLPAAYSHRGRPVADGADPIGYLSSPSTPVINGGYYEGRSPGRAAPLVVDWAAVDRLWTLTEHLVGLTLLLFSAAG